MTRDIRRTLVVVGVVAAGMFLPRLVSSREDVREIHIVAKDMTYRVDGVSGANPALRFTPGEKVRVFLRNDDKGMQHDFGIPAWGVTTGIVEWSSEKTVTFQVPASTARASYVCTPHSAMMAGAVILER